MASNPPGRVKEYRCSARNQKNHNPNIEMQVNIPAFLASVVSLVGFCHPLDAEEVKGDPSEARLNDNKWSEALVGNWRGVSSDPDMVVDCVVSYRADGTSTGEGTMTANGVITRVKWSQTWHIKDGHFHWKITQSNIPEIWPVEFSSSDKIVDVTAKEFTYVTEQGQRMVERRMNDEKGAEQGGAEEPATRSGSDSEGGDKPHPEPEGRSR